MKTYLISYDLNSPGQDYDALIEATKELAGTRWHHLDSVWIIRHPGPATQIRDALKPYLDQSDELLVVRLGGEGAWCGFSTSGSDWLKAHL